MALLPSKNFANAAMSAVTAQFNWAAQPITIYKEPAQTIVSNPSNLLYGYNSESQTTNSQITLASESAIYSGLVIYPLRAQSQNSSLFDNKIILKNDATYIKVTQPARDYLMNGVKNEKLEFDGQTWNIEGGKYQVQTFCSLNFYYFEVNGTN